MTSTQSKPPQNGRIIYCLLFHWSQSSSPAVSYSPRGVRLFEQNNSKLLFWLVVLSLDWNLRYELCSLDIRRFWGEGGIRGKENQKGRQWREKKLFTLFPLLLSLAPKEGHILKLDSRFMAAALKLFFFRSVKVNEYSCFSKYSSQVSVYEICSIIVSQSFRHWRTSFLP